MATKKRSSRDAIPYLASKPRKPAHERMKGPFDEWEIRDALSTLTMAIKIKRNPALLKAAAAHAKMELEEAMSKNKQMKQALDTEDVSEGDE